MKKIIKNPIFTFILGIIISGITVYAVTYEAKDVIYKNNISVKDALDDLYSKELENAYVGGGLYLTSSGTTYVNTYDSLRGTINEKLASVSNGVFTLKKAGKVKVCTMSKAHYEGPNGSKGRLYHNSTVIYETTANEIMRCDEINVQKDDTINYQIASNNTYGTGGFWIYYVN